LYRVGSDAAAAAAAVGGHSVALIITVSRDSTRRYTHSVKGQQDLIKERPFPAPRTLRIRCSCRKLTQARSVLAVDGPKKTPNNKPTSAAVASGLGACMMEGWLQRRPFQTTLSKVKPYACHHKVDESYQQGLINEFVWYGSSWMVDKKLGHSAKKFK